MEGHFTVFEYMYRDVGNFKTEGRLLLSGMDPEAEAVIRGCLEWGDQFVAEQVGVPALCEDHWDSVGEDPSDLDHAYHEFRSEEHTSELQSLMRISYAVFC